MPSFLRIVLINLAFVLVGLVGLELIFGSWLHPNLLNSLKITKNYQRTYDIKDLYAWDAPTSLYTRDAYGLRGDFDDPAEIDILTVGGSTTDQIYVSDGYTWQDVLQQSFAAAGASIVVANAGVDGQSSFGHLKNFDLWFPEIPDLQPPHVLFYIGINDFYREAANRYDGLERAAESPLSQLIRERSALHHLVRTVKGVYRAQFVDRIGHGAMDFQNLDWTDRPLLADHKSLMADRMAAYRDRLQALIDRTRAFGATPILVTQPTRYYKVVDGSLVGQDTVSSYAGTDYNGLDFYYMMKILDAVTMDTCKAAEAICIDMASGLMTELADKDFYDAFHMTPSGARKVGLYLFQQLQGQVR